MEILLSAAAAARYETELRAVVGDDLVLVTPDAGGPHDPEVAWLSTDLFYDAAARSFYATCTSAPSLRWLQSSAAGADVPLYRPLLERGVRVTASHENSVAIAEYVLGAVLRAYQQPERWADAQRRGAWEHHEFDEIAGTTWLLVGYGAIGQAIARRLGGFGARVLGVRRTPGPAPFADEIISPEALGDRVGEADVVVLCRPATSDGRPLFDDELLSRLRPGSILLNVGRGSLVDDAALVRGLDVGRPAVAILDVFDPEPLPGLSPLWRHPGVVLTPHASAGGLGRHERNGRLFVDNLARFLAGEPLPDELQLADLPSISDIPAQFKS